MDKKPFEVFDSQIVNRLSDVLKKIDKDMFRMSRTVGLPNSTIRRIYKLEVSSVKPGIVFQIKQHYPNLNTWYIFSGEGDCFINNNENNKKVEKENFNYLEFIDNQGKLISQLREELEAYKLKLEGKE